MGKNIKFIVVILGTFLLSCSPMQDSKSKNTDTTSPYSDTSSNFKYNSIYNKIVIQLLLHKNKYNEALNMFTSNIQYFQDESDFLDMTNIARNQRDFSSIAVIMNKWLELNPINITAHKISLSNYIEIGDFDSADLHLDFLFKTYVEKNNNKYYIDIEDIFSRNIIINNIISYFERNIGRLKSKDLTLSYINLLQKNNLDKLAISYLNDMDMQNNRSLIRGYSKSLSRLNDINTAIAVLERYLESSQLTDRETSFDLLALYLAKRDINKITSTIEKLISIDPDDNDFIFRIALLCFDNNYTDLSEKYFNILLSKSYAPDNINFFLGQIDYKHNRFDEALRHYERIQQGSFVNTKLLNVAKAISSKDGLSRASSFLENEVSIKSKSDLLNLLSLKLSLYQDPYDVDGVIATSSDILSSFPNNQRALYSRALAYEKIGDLANMSKDFELMISLDPYNSVALNAYGYSLSLHNKQLDYAEKLIRRAIDIDPGNAAILDSLAWVLYLDGSFTDAYKYASLAYTKDQDPEIVSHYYKILLKNGFIDEAQKILNESLKNNPDDKILLELLKDNINEATHL